MSQDLKVERTVRMENIIKKVKDWSKNALGEVEGGFYTLSENPLILMPSLRESQYDFQGVGEVTHQEDDDGNISLKCTIDFSDGEESEERVKEIIRVIKYRPKLYVTESWPLVSFFFEMGNPDSARRNLRHDFHDWCHRVLVGTGSKEEESLGVEYFSRVEIDEIKFDRMYFEKSKLGSSDDESSEEDIELNESMEEENDEDDDEASEEDGEEEEGPEQEEEETIEPENQDVMCFEMKTSISMAPQDPKKSLLWSQMLSFLARTVQNRPVFRSIEIDGVCLYSDKYLSGPLMSWIVSKKMISMCRKMMQHLQLYWQAQFLDENKGFEDLIKSALIETDLRTEETKMKPSEVSSEMISEWNNYMENLGEPKFRKQEESDCYKFVLEEAINKCKLEGSKYTIKEEKKLKEVYESEVNKQGDKENHKCLMRYPLLTQKSSSMVLLSEKEILESCLNDVTQRIELGEEVSRDEIIEATMLASIVKKWRSENFEVKDVGEKVEYQRIKEAIMTVGENDVTIKSNTVGEMRKEMGTSRHRYKRTDYDTSIYNNKEVFEYFLRHGLSDKKARMAAQQDHIKKIKEKQKKPLTLESNVECIRRFMSLDFGGITMKDLDRKDTENLYLDKLVNGGVRSRGSIIYEAIHKSKFHESLEIVGVIMNEIAAAYRQFTKPDSWVIKRLRDHNIVVMTKVFSMEKPAICKLIWTNDYEKFYEPCCVFSKSTKIFTIDKWRCTENESARRYLLPVYRVFWECNPETTDKTLFTVNAKTKKDIDECRVSEDYREMSAESVKAILKVMSKEQFSMEHTAFCIAMKLESKKQSANVAFQARYMYMKVLADNFEKYSVMDNLEKLPTRITTGLSAFQIKNILDSFWWMLKNRPTSEKIIADEMKLQDEFKNLRSFVSGKRIRTFEQAINLSYLGCVQNKIGGVDVIQDLQILEKTLKEEYIWVDDLAHRMKKLEEKGELDQALNENGVLKKDYVNTGSLKTKFKMLKKHNMNPRIIMLACNEALRTINPDKQKARNDILESLYLLNKEKPEDKYTTLKSSCIPPETYTFDSTKTAVKREKLILAFPKWFEKKLKEGVISGEMPSIPELADLVLQDKEWLPIVNMFKKPQHGTIREILVSSIESRIVQLYLENIGRAVCKNLDVETLTFGSKKMMFSKNHKREVKEIMKKYPSATCRHFNDVLDCTTWCQSFIMPVFSCCINAMLGPEIGASFTTAMNRFTNKKVIIPHSVLDNFVKRPKIDSTMAAINRLKKDFRGEGENPIMKEGENVFTNETNMFQGFMHYNSSAVGAVIDVLHEKFGRRYLDGQLKVNEIMNLEDGGNRLERTDVVISRHGAVSSDDRTSLWSVIIINKSKDNIQNNLSLSRYMQVVSRMLEPLMNAITIRVSDPKSARNMSEISEFNQNYSVRNSEVKAAIKIVGPCVNVPGIAGFLSQSRNFHETLKDCRSYGLTSISCAAISLEQSCLAWTLRGADVEHDASRMEDIYDHHNPLIGANILEPEAFSGIFGFNFARYNMMKRDVGFCKEMAACFKTMPDEFRAMDDKMYDSTISVDFNPGSNMRYLKFIENVKRIHKEKAGEDLDDYIKKILLDDSVVFSRSRDINSCRKRMVQKSFGQGIRESMKESDSIRVLSASIYLAKQCVCKISEEEEEIASSLEEVSEELNGANVQTMSVLKANQDSITRIRKIRITKSTIRWFCSVILDRYKGIEREDMKEYITKDKEEREKLEGFYEDKFNGCEEVIKKSFWPEQLALFEDIYRIVDSEAMKEIQEKKYRSVKKSTKIDLKKIDSRSTNLYEVCLKAWNSELITEEDEFMWNAAKEKYPFLSDTYQETVLRGSFKNAQELKNFLFRVSPKDFAITGVYRGLIPNENSTSNWRKVLMLNYGHNIKIMVKKIPKMSGEPPNIIILGAEDNPPADETTHDKAISEFQNLIKMGWRIDNKPISSLKAIEMSYKLDTNDRLRLFDSVCHLMPVMEIFPTNKDLQNQMIDELRITNNFDETQMGELLNTFRNPKDKFKLYMEEWIKTREDKDANVLMKNMPKEMYGWVRPENWVKEPKPEELARKEDRGLIFVKLGKEHLIAKVKDSMIESGFMTSGLKSYSFQIGSVLMSLGVKEPIGSNSLIRSKKDRSLVLNFDVSICLQKLGVTEDRTIVENLRVEVIKVMSLYSFEVGRKTVNTKLNDTRVFSRYLKDNFTLSETEMDIRNFLLSKYWVAYNKASAFVFNEVWKSANKKDSMFKNMIQTSRECFLLHEKVALSVRNRSENLVGDVILSCILSVLNQKVIFGKVFEVEFRTLRWVIHNLKALKIINFNLSRKENDTGEVIIKSDSFAVRSWFIKHYEWADFVIENEDSGSEDESEDILNLFRSDNVWSSLEGLDLRKIANLKAENFNKTKQVISEEDRAYDEGLRTNKIETTMWKFSNLASQLASYDLINTLNKSSSFNSCKSLLSLFGASTDGLRFLSYSLDLIEKKLEEEEMRGVEEEKMRGREVAVLVGKMKKELPNCESDLEIQDKWRELVNRGLCEETIEKPKVNNQTYSFFDLENFEMESNLWRLYCCKFKGEKIEFYGKNGLIRKEERLPSKSQRSEKKEAKPPKLHDEEDDEEGFAWGDEESEGDDEIESKEITEDEKQKISEYQEESALSKLMKVHTEDFSEKYKVLTEMMNNFEEGCKRVVPIMQNGEIIDRVNIRLVVASRVLWLPYEEKERLMRQLELILRGKEKPEIEWVLKKTARFRVVFRNECRIQFEALERMILEMSPEPENVKSAEDRVKDRINDMSQAEFKKLSQETSLEAMSITSVNNHEKQEASEKKSLFDQLLEDRRKLIEKSEEGEDKAEEIRMGAEIDFLKMVEDLEGELSDDSWGSEDEGFFDESGF